MKEEDLKKDERKWNNSFNRGYIQAQKDILEDEWRFLGHLFGFENMSESLKIRINKRIREIKQKIQEGGEK